MSIKTNFFLSLLFFLTNLSASAHDIKVVTFLVENYKPIKLKLLHYKDVEDIRKGLMYKEEIEPYDGLILDFKETQMARVWMKNMKMSIDIIFLSKDGKVLGTIENAPACQENQKCSITAVRGAKYIIETRASFIEKNFINYSNNTIIEDLK